MYTGMSGRRSASLTETGGGISGCLYSNRDSCDRNLYGPYQRPQRTGYDLVSHCGTVKSWRCRPGFGNFTGERMDSNYLSRRDRLGLCFVRFHIRRRASDRGTTADSYSPDHVHHRPHPRSSVQRSADSYPSTYIHASCPPWGSRNDSSSYNAADSGSGNFYHGFRSARRLGTGIVVFTSQIVGIWSSCKKTG